MPAGVVVGFEVIEVEHRDRVGMAVALSTRVHCGEVLIEAPSVADAGEHVNTRLVVQAAMQLKRRLPAISLRSSSAAYSGL